MEEGHLGSEGSIETVGKKVKGKVIPLQGKCGPEGG